MHWHQRLNSIKPAGLCDVAGTPTPDFTFAREQNHIPAYKEVLNKQQHSGRMRVRSTCYQAHKFVVRDKINVHPGSCLDSTQEIEPVTTGMSRPSHTPTPNQLLSLECDWYIKDRCLLTDWMKLDDIGHQVSAECWVVGCCVQRSCCECIVWYALIDRSALRCDTK